MKTNKPVRGETSADYGETGIPDPIELDKARQSAASELDDEGTFNAKFRDNVDKDLNAPMDPIEFENQRRAKDGAEAATDNSIVRITPNPIPGRDKKPIDGWLRVSVLYLMVLMIFVGADSVYSLSQIMKGFLSFLIYIPQYIVVVYSMVKCIYNIFNRRKTNKSATLLVVFVCASIIIDIIREFIESTIYGVVAAHSGSICDISCWYSEFTRPAMFMFVRALVIPCYIYLTNDKTLANPEI